MIIIGPAGHGKSRAKASTTTRNSAHLDLSDLNDKLILANPTDSFIKSRKIGLDFYQEYYTYL